MSTEEPFRSRLRARILERIYHEDELLASRTSHFLTATSFLVVALATLEIAAAYSSANLQLVTVAIALVGLFLSFFHLAMGRRHAIAIAFWRAYEQSLIDGNWGEGGEVRDVDQRHFYTHGVVEVGGGAIGVAPRPARGDVRPAEATSLTTLRERYLRLYPRTEVRSAAGSVRLRGTMRESFPWSLRYVGSTNDVVGVLFPAAITVFWVAVTFTLEEQFLLFGLIPTVGLGVAVGTAVVFGYMWWRRPSYAVWVPPTKWSGTAPDVTAPASP